MQFEDILSICIDALARGEAVEECLARYPMHAEALAPLLQLAASLQVEDKPRLSKQSFARGRLSLATAAKRKPPPPVKDNSNAPDAPMDHRYLAAYRRLPQPRAQNGEYRSSDPGISRNGQAHDARQSHTARSAPKSLHRRQNLFVRYRWQSRHSNKEQKRPIVAHASIKHAHTPRQQQLLFTAFIFVLFIGGSVLLQQTILSLPGSPFYGIKTLAERTQGVLMIAAGENASWHAAQMIRRVDEFSQLTSQSQLDGQTSSPIEANWETTLINNAVGHAEQALAAVALLTKTEQRSFYAEWLTQLQLKQREIHLSTEHYATVHTLLQETMVKIAVANSALDQPTETPSPAETVPSIGATQLPAISLTAAIQAPIDTPDVSPVGPTPTLLLSATTSPLSRINEPTATRVLRATAIPSATNTPTTRPPLSITPTALATATSLPVLPHVIPLESQSNDPADDSAPNVNNDQNNNDRQQEDHNSTTDGDTTSAPESNADEESATDNSNADNSDADNSDADNSDADNSDVTEQATDDPIAVPTNATVDINLTVTAQATTGDTSDNPKQLTPVATAETPAPTEANPTPGNTSTLPVPTAAPDATATGLAPIKRTVAETPVAETPVVETPVVRTRTLPRPVPLDTIEPEQPSVATSVVTPELPTPANEKLPPTRRPTRTRQPPETVTPDNEQATSTPEPVTITTSTPPN